MDIVVLNELRAERDKLDRVISILEGERKRKRKYTKRNGKRKLSAAAKKRISTAMKKRWAARKKAAK